MIDMILFLETRVKIDYEPDRFCNAKITYPENRYNNNTKSQKSNNLMQ